MDRSPARRGRTRGPVLLCVIGLLVSSCSGNPSSSPATGTTGSGVSGPSGDEAQGTAPATTAGTTTTAPVPPASVTAGAGALVSPSGVMLPVVGGNADGWKVLTPCGHEAVVKGGKGVASARVVIDPGHGGADTGTVAASGLTEKELNLAVATKVVDDLTALGIPAVLTRTKDYYVSLATRSAIANALAPSAFLSIHHNGGPAAARTSPGTQLFYRHDSAAAKRMAGLVYEEVTRALGAYHVPWKGPRYAGAIFRLGSDGKDFYGVIRNTDPPAALIEAAYLSNQAEAALLATDNFRAVEARAIATGINRFLTSADPGSGYQAPVTNDNGGSSGTLQSCVDPPLQ